MSRGSHGSEVPVGVRIVTDVLVRHVPPLQQVLVPLVLQKTPSGQWRHAGVHQHTLYLQWRNVFRLLTCQSLKHTNSYLSELHHHFCALSSHCLHRRNQNQWITHMNQLIHTYLWGNVKSFYRLFISSDLIYRSQNDCFIYTFNFTFRTPYKSHHWSHCASPEPSRKPIHNLQYRFLRCFDVRRPLFEWI